MRSVAPWLDFVNTSLYKQMYAPARRPIPEAIDPPRHREAPEGGGSHGFRAAREAPPAHADGRAPAPLRAPAGTPGGGRGAAGPDRASRQVLGAHRGGQQVVSRRVCRVERRAD